MSTTEARTGSARLRSAGDTALTVAAVLGALVAGFAVLAAVFHLSIVLFKTGSMSPTIPAGSAALVREIPAADARKGDIVTVDRPGALPVTHRVVSTEDLGDGRARLVLKGDANPVADPAPYTVDTVRLTLASVPGIAPLFVVAGNPLVLGGITLGAAALVGWAFWPRSPERAKRGGRHGGGRHDGGRHSSGQHDGGRHSGEQHDGGRHGSGAAGSGALAAIAVLTLVASAVLSGPDRAAADTTRTVYTGAYLTLVSIEDPAAFLRLEPGRTIDWEVGISAQPPEPGEVRIGISGTGPLTREGALTVSILSCAVEWTGSSCASDQRTVVGSQTLDTLLADARADGVVELATMQPTEQRWLTIALTLSEGVPPGTGADIRVHAWGKSGAVTTGDSTGSLAATGADPLSALPLTALALTAGLGAAALAHRKRARKDG